MLTIYGVYQSRASRVYWMAEELGLAFASVPVTQARNVDDPLAADARLNTHSPSFRAINPMGLIPCIDDDGLMLHESLAITQYLAKKHGGPLAPKDLAEEAQISMWSLWAATAVETHSVKIVLAHDTGIADSPGGKDTIAIALRMLKSPLTVLENHLKTNGFVVGGRFTVADLNLTEVLRYAMSEHRFMAQFPAIMAWYAAAHEREAFQKMWAVREKETP